MGIEIPKRLKNHLHRDDDWYKRVIALNAEVETFLSVSPEFFPGYTVHGVKHNNEVLAHADTLIAKKMTLIPFDMDARKVKFPEAFAMPDPFFDYIRRNSTP